MNLSELSKKYTQYMGNNKDLVSLGAIASGALSALPDWYQGLSTDPQENTAIYGNSQQDPIARLVGVMNGNDMSQAIDNINSKSTDFSEVDNNENLYNAWDNNDMQQGSSYQFGIRNIADNLTSVAKGASTGLVLAGPWGALGGAIVGELANLGSQIGGKSRMSALNQAKESANQRMVNNFTDQSVNNMKKQLRLNSYAEGGEMNGITEFNTGGTHEQNPFGGIPQGIAPDGQPNLVEEGEVKYKDYIYSDRLKTNKTLLKNYSLPEKYSGLSFAKLADKLQLESEERPNDPVSLATLDKFMSRLKDAQEEVKAKKMEREMAKVFDSMTPEEQNALLSQAIAPQLTQQQPQQSPMGMGQLQQSMQGMTQGQPMEQPSMEQPMIEQQPMGNEGEMKNGGHLFVDGGPNYSLWNSQEDLNKYYQDAITREFQTLKGNKYNVDRLPHYALTPSQSQAWATRLAGSSDEKEQALGQMLQQQWTYDNGKMQESTPYQIWAKNNFTGNDYTLKTDHYQGIQHTPVWNLQSDGSVLVPQASTPAVVTPTTRYWRMNDDGTREQLSDISWYQSAESPYKLNNELTEQDDQYIDYYFDKTNGGFAQAPVTPKSDTFTGTTYSTPSINLLRMAPVVGSGIGALASTIMGPDYTLGNRLEQLASKYKPIAPSLIGGYRKYVPYDINLTNAEAMAQEAAQQRANRAITNRGAQQAMQIVTDTAARRGQAATNLAWQQANEKNRLDTDTYNLGIDRINQGTVQAYDQLNQQIRDKSIDLLAKAAQAKDASDTAWSQGVSTTGTNFLNNLGNLGKDRDAFEQVRTWLKANPQYITKELAELYGIHK